MVKVKLHKSNTQYNNISEGSISDMIKNVKKNSNEDILNNEISSLWNKLLKKKKLDLRKLYSSTMENSMQTIPLAKMNTEITVNCTDAITGEKTEVSIIPQEVASFCELAKTKAMSDPILGPILNRFPKPVIWTFAIDTAASDGVRIAFNPVFAQQLIVQGQGMLKQMVSSGKNVKGNDKAIYMAKYFLFVLTHEAYHQIYRHREQAELKQETMGGKNHNLANIAMDIEINRDIERQLPKWFKGATVEANGCFDTEGKFERDPWQLIFDAFYYNGVEPPQTNQNPINNSNSQPQQGQTGQQGSQGETQDTDSNDSQQSGQSGQQGCSSSQSQQGQQGGMQISKQGGQGSSQEDDSDSDLGDNEDLQAPDMSGKSKEYQDAYADELQKELNKVMGKQNKNNSSQQGQAGQQGNQQSGQQSSQGGSQAGSETSDSFDDTIDNMNNQKGDLTGSQNNSNMNSQDSSDSDSTSNNGQMSKEEKEAREQARKDVQKALETLKNEIEDQMNQEMSDEEIEKQLEGKEFNTTTSSVFGGADMLNQEQMSEMAREAGDPYTSEELTANVDELNKQFNDKHKAALASVSPELSQKLTDITNKLKREESWGNWKEKLKKHFRDSIKGSIYTTRSKRVMAQADFRDDYAMPYKNRVVQDSPAANIFYLIDNSGSMYFAGDNVFYSIFKQIVTIEKQCHVAMSARAYFSSGSIVPKNVEIWNDKTPIQQRLDKLADRGNTGGTDIPGNVVAVTKLKKPYYYNNNDHHTTILVFTDGENNDDNGWNMLKLIPGKIRKDLVFVIINDHNGLSREIPKIRKQGIPMKNIIGIDISKIK